MPEIKINILRCEFLMNTEYSGTAPHKFPHPSGQAPEWGGEAEFHLKLADVQTVASKLADLPKDALLYISGYAEGQRDAIERQKDQLHHSALLQDTRPGA